jgi:hypothetical protein
MPITKAKATTALAVIATIATRADRAPSAADHHPRAATEIAGDRVRARIARPETARAGRGPEAVAPAATDAMMIVIAHPARPCAQRQQH